jgi:type IV pilus assembly protein PilY1
VLGSSYTQPTLIRTSAYTALWTGSAPDPLGNAFVNIIDVQSGHLAVPMVHVSTHTDVNMMSGAVGIDWNFDGYDDIVYQADLKGNLYRWVRDNDNNWWGWIVFDTGGQPIQAKPVAAFFDGNSMMVMFGTGRYLQASDVTSTGQQTFYALRDNLNFYTSYGPGDLVDQTSSIQDTAGSQGWRFDLTMDSGERVVEPAAVVEGVVYFTSFAPDAGECSAGGRSWLYAVDFKTGAPIDPETLEPSDDVASRGTELGDGVASRPVISLGDGSLIVQTSDARLSIEDLIVPPRTMVVRSWREQTQGNAQTSTTTTQSPQQ